jgi:ABC-2 type transport system permease protein
MMSLAHPSPGLLPAIWRLILMRARITINTFRHAKTGRKILTVVAAFGLLAFAAGIFVLSWLLLGFLRSPALKQYIPFDTAPFLQAVPVLILSALFLGILLSSFGVLLQGLYLSQDMDFLLTTPVPVRAVFVSKMLQAVLPNFGLTALFGLPVLYGLGLAGHYNLLYYPLVVLIMIVLALAAAGISSLLVMAVVRVFPARRVAEVLGFVGATLTILLSQTGNLMNMNHAAGPSDAQLSRMFALLTRLNTPWLPLNWAGRGLVELGQGHWLTGVGLVVLTLGLSSLAFWFSLATAERWYYTGWAGMQVVARRKKSVRATQAEEAAAQKPVSGLARLFPAPVRAIVRKDFIVLRRDLRNLSGLITPLIFGAIYTLTFLRAGGELTATGGGSDAPAWFMTTFKTLFAYGNVGMSLFVGWMLLARLAGVGFSQEGKSYWVLKSAPLGPRTLLTSKFVVAYLPALALGWFFMIMISVLQHISLSGFFYGLLAVAMCLAGMTGLLLGFGVAGAKFDWEDPRRMSSGGMGCLGQAVAGFFLPVSFGFFIGPLYLVAALKLPMLIGYLGGGLLGIAICLVGALVPLGLASRRVERLGEA